MFDCLDTFGRHPSNAAARTAPKARAGRTPPAALTRRLSGRNWVRFQAKTASYGDLAKVREVALYLNANIEKPSDDSLLVLDISLSQILALSERFGSSLAVEAHISTAPQAA